jgi:hypothetical protein
MMPQLKRADNIDTHRNVLVEIPQANEFIIMESWPIS